MKKQSASGQSALSAAKLAANQANAQLSTGPITPEGKARSRSNATKFGLTARVAWPGQDPQADQEFFHRAWQRLGPRNAIEELFIASLLQTHLRDNFLLEAEKTVLTRRAPLQTLQDTAYPFLLDDQALKAVNLLARQVVHLSRLFDQDLAALLKERKNDRGQRQKGDGVTPPIPHPPKAQPAAPKPGPETATPAVSRGGLEALLADRHALLPGEDAQGYATLARALWTTYQPANLLEEFLVSDLIQTQWRLDRLLQIQAVFLQRSAISATGHDCGFGFGFVHDCQRTQTLEALRNYECALRKRLNRRMALWPKLRQQGWQDLVLPDSLPSTAPPLVGSIPVPASHLPSHSEPPPDPSANTAVGTPPVEVGEALAGQTAIPGTVNETHPA